MVSTQQTNRGSVHRMLGGISIEMLDWLGVRLMFAGAGLGVLALLVSLASAYVLYEVADLAQKELAHETKLSGERIASLSADADASRAEMAKANAAIAASNEAAEKARAEQERLKSQLAWRRLSKEQHDLLVHNARQVRQTGSPVSVAYPSGDSEAAIYANEITGALREGGLQIDGPDATIWVPIPPFGITVAQPGPEQVAHPLAQVLAASGLTVKIELDSPSLRLVVGSKPAPF